MADDDYDPPLEARRLLRAARVGTGRAGHLPRPCARGEHGGLALTLKPLLLVASLAAAGIVVSLGHAEATAEDTGLRVPMRERS